MGSESDRAARTGIKRRDGGGTGYATQYVIVDLDISAAKLTAKYAGTKRALWVAEVIAGCAQLERVKVPPSDAFVRGLRRAKKVPAIVAIDLGDDAKGVNHVVDLDGRQRIMSRRINDALDVEDGLPKRMLDCDYFVPSAKTPREDVVNFRVNSARRVPLSFSARAENAFDLDQLRISHEDIAPMVEAQNEEEVALLILLHGCERAVKDAVNSGLVGLAAVKRLATLSPIQQVHACARKATPPGNGKAARAARDAAAPPRLKAKPGAYMVRLAAALPERTYDRDEVAAVLAHVAGGGDVPSWLVGPAAAAKGAMS